MMKRVVFMFSAAFFAFGVNRAVAYDFKVCPLTPMGYAHATTVSAICHDVTLVDINAGDAVAPAGQCVSGSTASICLIAKVEASSQYGLVSWLPYQDVGQMGGTWRLWAWGLCKERDFLSNVNDTLCPDEQ